MTSPDIRTIALANLLVDLANPRHTEQASQREAIATIAFDQGIKLVNLAKDIAERGLNPGDFPLVTPAEEDESYIVLEGNRRLAALKLVTSPELLSSIGLPNNLSSRFRDIHSDYGSTLPSEVTCSVLSRDEARYWILQKHTGENEGVGIVMWDGRARQRFRGMSPALQVIDLIEHSDLIDQGTRGKLEKISISNIERILGTPEARQELGVDIKKGELVFVEPEDVVLERLALVVADIANKRKKVTDLDSREQRIAYAKEVAGRRLPLPVSEQNNEPSAQLVDATNRVFPRQIRPDRKTLIPRRFKVAIEHSRSNRVYHELQKLNVDDFVNCAAVMLRVFLEFSVDHFGQMHSIPLTYPPSLKPEKAGMPPKEMNLRDKIKAVADHMESNSLLSLDELRGIRSLIANNYHSLTITSLNAYIHNKDYHPTPSDLKANWDSIERFVEVLWQPKP